MSSKTGKTYRSCLTAMLLASQGKTVVYFADSNRTIKMHVMSLCQALAYPTKHTFGFNFYRMEIYCISDGMVKFVSYKTYEKNPHILNGIQVDMYIED